MSHFHPAAYFLASCPAGLPPPAVLFDNQIEMLESTDPAALPVLRLFFETLRPSVSPSHPGNLVNHSRAVAAPAFHSPARNNSGTSKPAAPAAHSFPSIPLKYHSAFR